MSRQRKIAVLAALMMSGIMSFVLTGLLSFIANGPSRAWFGAWWHSLVIAWPVACMLVVVLGPLVAGQAARIVGRFGDD